MTLSASLEASDDFIKGVDFIQVVACNGNVTGKELLKLLRNDGWALDRVTGSHHIMVKEDKEVSVPVHGKKDVPTGLLHRILKEAGLK